LESQNTAPNRNGETKMKKPASTKSSGNVFADIGLPDAEVSLLKADLIINIADLIKAKGLTQSQAATIMGAGTAGCIEADEGAIYRILLRAYFRDSHGVGRECHHQGEGGKNQKPGPCRTGFRLIW
jgi:hypothetical protein